MMAKKGMSLDAQSTTLRICVSKEQAERMEPLPMSKADCKQDVVSRTSSSMKVKWACGGNDPSNGEGEMHFSSDKAFTGRAVVNSVHKGKPDRMDVESVGKWVSADLRRRQTADCRQAVIRPGANAKDCSCSPVQESPWSTRQPVSRPTPHSCVCACTPGCLRDYLPA